MKLLAFLICLLAPRIHASGQEVASVEAQANEIVARFGGWRKASSPRIIAQMNGEERGALIRYYRARLAQAGGDPFMASNSQMRLLYLGDLEYVKSAVQCVLDLDQDSKEAQEAADVLLSAARPESVQMLAVGMSVNEPFVIQPALGDVGSAVPKSYGISSAILGIVSRSPAFSDEVRSWANDNRKVSPKKTLPMVRTWWSENEHFLKAGDYHAVRPGEDLRNADLAAAAAVLSRKEGYRQALIAKGKYPSNIANWREWTEVIYPSLTNEQPIATPSAGTPTPPGLKKSEAKSPGRYLSLPSRNGHGLSESLQLLPLDLRCGR